MTKLFIQKNFLSWDECKSLVEGHRSFENPMVHENTKVISLVELMQHNVFIRHLYARLCYFAQTCFNDKNYFVDYSHVVERIGGMDSHLDFKNQVATSIVYLNDDYEGGETIVDDIVIKPERGKIICFEGSASHHEVNDFKNTTRFTINSWYLNGKYVNTL